MKINRILGIAFLLSIPFFASYIVINRSALVYLYQYKYLTVCIAFISATVLLMVAHIIRAYKTKALIDGIKETSLKTNTRALFIGYLFNALLPFRLGEFIRALVLGKGLKMSSTFMFGLVILDRAVDVLLLALFGFFMIFTTDVFNAPDVHRIILTASSALLLLACILLSILYIIRLQPEWLLRLVHWVTALFNNRLRDSLRFKVWSLMYGLERVLNIKSMIRYVVISGLMWSVYLIAIVPITLVFLHGLGIGSIAGISLVNYLGILAPAGPSHIGSYQEFVLPFIKESSEPIKLQSVLIFAWVLQVIPALIVGLLFVKRTRETMSRPVPSHGNIISDKLLRDSDMSKELDTFLEAFFTNNSLSRIMHRMEVNEGSKLIHYFKGGSNAVTALVHENGNFIVRKITPIQYKYKLESQYNWLKDKSSLNKVVNVLSDESTSSYYKIDLEYNKDYTPLFDFIHSMPINKSKLILRNVFEYLFKNIYKPEKEKTRPKDLKLYLNNRCLSKIKQAAEVNDEIRSLLGYKELIINGTTYKNIPVILEEIKKNKVLYSTLATYRKCSIHGDTTIDNILARKKDSNFLLIDPTDNENEISGPVFDFARMAQSLNYGYEFLCQNEQPVSVINNRIDFEYSISSNYADLNKYIVTLRKKLLTPSEQKSVLFHTGVLYSRMLTHRVVINPKTAAKFYAISVIAFNDFMKASQ
jgi:hypothetical protein